MLFRCFIDRRDIIRSFKQASWFDEAPGRPAKSQKEVQEDSFIADENVEQSVTRRSATTSQDKDTIEAQYGQPGTPEQKTTEA